MDEVVVVMVGALVLVVGGSVCRWIGGRGGRGDALSLSRVCCSLSRALCPRLSGCTCGRSSARLCAVRCVCLRPSVGVWMVSRAKRGVGKHKRL